MGNRQTKNKKPSINHGVLIRQIIYTYMGDHQKNLFVLLKAVAKTFRSMPGYTPTVPAPQFLKELLVAQGDARWEKWKMYTTNVGTKKSTL